eukprot:2324692-Alexandrium_andersonii.AAC.1
MRSDLWPALGGKKAGTATWSAEAFDAIMYCLLGTKRSDDTADSKNATGSDGIVDSEGVTGLTGITGLKGITGSE